jgi:DNA-binding IclR family transcriptional regulator
MGERVKTTESTGWTFLSNHAFVLVCIAEEPEIRLNDLAERVHITRRAVQRIIADLEKAGYVTRIKEGRRNRYQLDVEMHLRHPINAHCTVREVLELMTNAQSRLGESSIMTH